MRILIDGYNVLKQGLGKTHIEERERQQFINQVRQYVQAKNHTITVVFDGGDGLWPTVTSKKGVAIMYAGIKNSADDVIKKIVQGAAADQVLLVSSDNELGRFAQQYGIASIDAVAFYNLIRHPNTQSSTKQQPIIKTSAEYNPELDALMQESGMVQIKDELPEQGARTSSARRPSKHERQILKKIKKL